MDFITQLPLTRAGHDAIVVFVDLFSKMVHFAPLTTNANAPTVAKIFFDTVFRLHGLPQVIVSDRDTRFTSQFWKALFKHLGTKLAMSTDRQSGLTEHSKICYEFILT